MIFCTDRDSKLTYLLTDCLSGQSKCLMFCQLSPARSSAQESQCSLQFATRAKNTPGPPSGDAFAILRIPRLGAGWAKPVYQGVAASVLVEGIGHYPDTQPPGEVGNVGLAGHRAGHGNPLIDIDTVRPGDAIVVETTAAYSVYRAVRSEIVPPTDVKVLLPVPEKPGAVATEAWLTLTSCEPKYGSTNRFIVFAKLDRTIPRDQGPPTDALARPGEKG